MYCIYWEDEKEKNIYLSHSYTHKTCLIKVYTKCVYKCVYITFMISVAKNGSLREFRYNEYKSFASHLMKKIWNDTNIAFRIIAIMFGVSYLRGFSDSSCVRFFLSICLIWSVVLTGAFQVNIRYLLFIYLFMICLQGDEKGKKNYIWKLFTLHLLPIKFIWRIDMLSII